MSNDLNQCNFIGRLGKDVEMRYQPSGDAIASFSIAVGSQWNDRNTGEKREVTEWVNCTAFKKLAEICGEHLHKGSKVFITGHMKTDKWTDKENVTRYSTKIIVDKLQMLDPKPSGDQQQGGQPAQQQQPAAAPMPDTDFNDDTPF